MAAQAHLLNAQRCQVTAWAGLFCWCAPGLSSDSRCVCLPSGHVPAPPHFILHVLRPCVVSLCQHAAAWAHWFTNVLSQHSHMMAQACPFTQELGRSTTKLAWVCLFTHLLCPISAKKLPEHSCSQACQLLALLCACLSTTATMWRCGHTYLHACYVPAPPHGSMGIHVCIPSGSLRYPCLPVPTPAVFWHYNLVVNACLVTCMLCSRATRAQRFAHVLYPSTAMWQNRLSCLHVVSILGLPHRGLNPVLPDGRWANLSPGLFCARVPICRPGHISPYLLHCSPFTRWPSNTYWHVYLVPVAWFGCLGIPVFTPATWKPGLICSVLMHAESQGRNVTVGVCLFPCLPVPALLCRDPGMPVCMPAIFPCHSVVAWTHLSHACWLPTLPRGNPGPAWSVAYCVLGSPSDSQGFSTEFCQIKKKESTPNIPQIIAQNRSRRKIAQLFSWLPKSLYKDTTQKENSRPISLMNIEARVLNKILAKNNITSSSAMRCRIKVGFIQEM